MELWFITGLVLLVLSLVFLTATWVAVSEFGRDNNLFMGLIYRAQLGRWFPKSVSYFVAKLRVLGGWLWGPRQSFAKERLLSFNALIFFRSVSEIQAMIQSGRSRLFRPNSVPDDIRECDVILFWHSIDYLYDLNDLLHNTQGDDRPILIVRRYPHPSFQKLVSDLCGLYGREVIYVLSSEDLIAVKRSGRDRSAIWLIGAEFMYREGNGAAKTFQRKVLTSKAVCVHTPWPGYASRWEKSGNIKAARNLPLKSAQTYFGLGLIWPHYLKAI